MRGPRTGALRRRRRLPQAPPRRATLATSSWVCWSHSRPAWTSCRRCSTQGLRFRSAPRHSRGSSPTKTAAPQAPRGARPPSGPRPTASPGSPRWKCCLRLRTARPCRTPTAAPQGRSAGRRRTCRRAPWRWRPRRRCHCSRPRQARLTLSSGRSSRTSATASAGSPLRSKACAGSCLRSVPPTHRQPQRRPHGARFLALRPSTRGRGRWRSTSRCTHRCRRRGPT
mmetsp:Transcript_36446/g.94020  ORF Transcript_36446/g.94020 Transcript_36446/m.94020 type:complete len:226 (-) Transcript_36446:780-1457(-)